MYTGHVACCHLVSRGDYASGTDGWTPDHYITLSAKCDKHNKQSLCGYFSGESDLTIYHLLSHYLIWK